MRTVHNTYAMAPLMHKGTDARTLNHVVIESQFTRQPEKEGPQDKSFERVFARNTYPFYITC